MKSIGTLRKLSNHTNTVRNKYSLLSSVIEIRIWIVWVFVVNVVIIGVFFLLHHLLLRHYSIRTGLLLLTPLLFLSARFVIAVIRTRTSNNGLSHTTNPIVLFLFGISIQQKGSFGSGNLKGMSLFGFQIGRFDCGAVRQINHSMRSAILILAKEEFRTFQEKITPAPILNKRIDRRQMR
jgi:hypothetical protein